MKAASVDACDFVILAAQREEVVALTKLTGSTDILTVGGVIYPRISVPVQTSNSPSEDRYARGVVVTIGGMGRVNAAISTSKVLHAFSPHLLILIGVAGGFAINGVSLGDIIVADTIIDYEEQRLSDAGIEYRFKNFEANETALKASRDAMDSEWLTGHEPHSKRRPCIHFGPILSGDKVFASHKISSSYLDLNPDLLGVEMEGAGVAATVSGLADNTRFLMIRGIVDFADSQKREQAETWFELTCDTLARYTLATITKYYS